jgi:hypothetical protein
MRAVRLVFSRQPLRAKETALVAQLANDDSHLSLCSIIAAEAGAGKRVASLRHPVFPRWWTLPSAFFLSTCDERTDKTGNLPAARLPRTSSRYQSPGISLTETCATIPPRVIASHVSLHRRISRFTGCGSQTSFIASTVASVYDYRSEFAGLTVIFSLLSRRNDDKSSLDSLRRSAAGMLVAGLRLVYRNCNVAFLA